MIPTDRAASYRSVTDLEPTTSGSDVGATREDSAKEDNPLDIQALLKQDDIDGFQCMILNRFYIIIKHYHQY